MQRVLTVGVVGICGPICSLTQTEQDHRVPGSREYPTTSAARIAASLLWTRCSAIETVSPSRALSAKFYASAEGMSIEAEWAR